MTAADEDFAEMHARHEVVLKALRPSRRKEVRQMISEGTLAYLPSQVIFERGRIFLGDDVGWCAAPEMDPATMPIERIEVLFVFQHDDGRFGLQIDLFTAEEMNKQRRTRR